MLINTILGLVLPWILTILFFPNKEIIVLIAPISSVIAFTINTIGYYFFWDLKPILPREQSISSLPLNLGIFSLLGCLLIYSVVHFTFNTYIIILVFAIFTTAMELVGVKIRKVIYRNGWNVYYTLISYLTAYTLVYYYYLLLKQLNIFSAFIFTLETFISIKNLAIINLTNETLLKISYYI